MADYKFTGFTNAMASQINENFSNGIKCNNRQNNTTNTTVVDQRICQGWGFIQGDGASDNLSEAVTFPITFDSAPIVIISSIGQIGGTPSAIGDFDVVSGVYAQCYIITTTGFRAAILTRDNTALSNSQWFGYSWIAIGTKI